MSEKGMLIKACNNENYLQICELYQSFWKDHRHEFRTIFEEVWADWKSVLLAVEDDFSVGNFSWERTKSFIDLLDEVGFLQDDGWMELIKSERMEDEVLSYLISKIPAEKVLAEKDRLFRLCCEPLINDLNGRDPGRYLTLKELSRKGVDFPEQKDVLLILEKVFKNKYGNGQSNWGVAHFLRSEKKANPGIFKIFSKPTTFHKELFLLQSRYVNEAPENIKDLFKSEIELFWSQLSHKEKRNLCSHVVRRYSDDSLLKTFFEYFDKEFRREILEAGSYWTVSSLNAFEHLCFSLIDAKREIPTKSFLNATSEQKRIVREIANAEFLIVLLESILFSMGSMDLRKHFGWRESKIWLIAEMKSSIINIKGF